MTWTLSNTTMVRPQLNFPFNFPLPFQLERPAATCWTRSPQKRRTQSLSLARWTSSAKTEGLCRSLSLKPIHSPPGSASPGSSCTSCSSSSSSTRGSLALCSRTRRTGAPAKQHCSNLSASVLANDDDQMMKYSKLDPPESDCVQDTLLKYL